MKTLFTKSLLIICATALFSIAFNSCKKYPDGPSFSLLTKKSRLCNTWVMDKYIVNGDDQTSFFNTVLPGYKIEVKKDDTYTSSANTGTIEEGKWEFTNNKEHVKTTVNSTGASTDHQILRLKDKELWLKQTDANNTIIELHLKEK